MPDACQITYDEECSENQRRHPHTRARMARANDAGVDVIEVLLEDFTATLCRQGLKRPEIQLMRQEAVKNIDRQRKMRGSKDIVDMVMDRAIATTPGNFKRPIRKREAKRTGRTQNLAKSLRRVLAQETALWSSGKFEEAQTLTRARQATERELVLAVISMAEASGTMVMKERAQWCALFRRKTQEKREKTGQRIDVLKELARYL